ncbi:hypothetical protein [Leptospira brenneri]|uniref:Uncharacterized protein n=1 Tax=Leptospira brenneri TaxID=2023182 RepID=A0A2M9XYB8_9LEPT|nr:hypothetical protein [Leptospira brenneri]PJZ44315.1 hypothetical protein CH361_16010 [Leptospira brenneri]TGK93042.1 hypothetical protein EHQ30_11315 [Leptospira brenneri]
MIKFESDQMRSRIWEKPEETAVWDFEDISKSLQSPNEVILVGESDLNAEFRRWLINHDRNLAKRLIAVIGNQGESKINQDLVSHFKEKYFRGR